MGGTGMWGCLEGCGAVLVTTGSALALQKVMHTRKRHSELYHELNQKFHTLDRYRAPAAGSSKVRFWGSHPAPICCPTARHLPWDILGRWSIARRVQGLSAGAFSTARKAVERLVGWRGEEHGCRKCLSIPGD